MFRPIFGSRLPAARPHIVPPSRRQRVLAHRSLVCSFLLTLLLLLSQVLGNWGFLVKPAEAASAGAPPSAPASLTFQKFLQLSHRSPHSVQPKRYPPVPSSSQEHAADYAHLPPSVEPASMKPISQVLGASLTTAGVTGKALDLVGSDGRLEVVIQPGSLDLSHATVSGGGTPTGSFTLQLTQVHGHFVGLVNGLGGYEVQLVDGQGRTISGIVLRSPVTFIYHYQPWEMTSLGLDPGHLLMIWPAQVVAAQKAHQSTAPYFVVLHNDAHAHTLTGQSTVLSSGPFVTGTGTPDDQSSPTPHLASVGGNSGQLTYSYPIRVPPGPAGFAPQLALNYSSSEPNGRHSRVSPANDVGDGWTLNLGSVTAQTAPAGSPGNPGSGSYTWYFLNDVANVSDRLVPGSTSGFYETEHISRLRVQQGTGAGGQPCFLVWDKGGTYYQFGCTTDSLQYWTDSSGTRTNYRWDLNQIIAPNEHAGAFKTTTVTYQQDITHDSGNHPTVRDAGIQKITYSYSSGSSTTVVGTVDFTYLAPPYSTNYNCSSPPPDSQTTTTRCDDPISRTNAGITVPPPLVMDTMTLTRVASYVGSDSNGNQEDYRYDFSYQDRPFADCNDDYTQYAEYCAGEHLLTTVKPYIYQNGTSHQMPALDLSYSGALTNNYFDSQNKIKNGSQQYNQQTYWLYLTKYIDTLTGVGGTIAYGTAYSNTHGTPNDSTTGDDRYDPLYCSTHSDCTGNYANPDDHAWSMQVVTTITALGKDSSAPNSSLSPAQTTYAYRLAKTGTYVGTGTNCYPAGSDQDCVGDNWLPSLDNNWQDYYDAEFRGFNDVTINGPASGEMRVDAYFSTKGWGTSHSDGGNYNSGHLYEEDVYGPYGYIQLPVLLSITTNTYTSNPNSCFGSSLNAVYNPCEVMITKSRTTTYDTTSTPNPNAPWIEHDYTYDDFNSMGLTSGYHNLLDDQVFTSNGIASSTTPTFTRVLTYALTNQTVGSWTYYDVDKVSSSEIDDNTGKVWQCQNFTYDEGAGAGVPTPDAGWLTTTKNYSDCTNKSGTAITTYRGYDQYGNLVATVDGVGTANAGLYSSNGCTLSQAPAIFTASSNWSAGRYTGCTTYQDGGTTNIYESVPLTDTNAFGFQSSTTYDYTQGALPLVQTDINGQKTTTSYSFNSSSASNGKRTVSVSLPGEAAGGYTTQSNTYSACTSSSSLPCFEIDSNSSQYSGAIKRTFYDSLGRLVETRTPGPGSYDTIVFTTYNDQSHSVFTSVPFQVARATTWVDPNTATDYTGVAPGGSAVYYDTLGRKLAYQDPAFGSSQEPGVNCSYYIGNTFTGCTNYVLGSPYGDSTSYEAVQTVDANSHSVADFNDALGRTRYTQWYSGNAAGVSGPPANTNATEQKTIQYNALGKPTSIAVTDLAPQSGQSITTVTSTSGYDDLGRLTSVSDPDRGSHSYTYDANDQLTKDVSGSRTLGYGYDLLGRVGCVQDQPLTANATGACSTTGANPFVQNTYDADPTGVSWSGTNYAKGRLTQSFAINYFPGPDYTQGKVTENRQYDQRGRVITQRLQLTATGGSLTFPALPTFQQTLTYNDADQLITSTTNTTPAGQGYTFTNVYDSTGSLSGLSNNGTATANLATLSYSTHAQLSSINFLASDGSTALATDQFSYDANLRPLSTSASWQSGGGTIFSQTRTYDPAGNVTSLATTQAAVPNTTNSGGSETEAFCYDEYNRLVWAGNTGAPPAAGSGTCGSGPSNSLAGANYSNAYVYTHLGQLWQGPYNGTGSYQYLYCNSSQPHQLSWLYQTGTTCATTGGKTQTYGAQYDSWGNLTTRTATGSGSTTATLAYDGQDHLVRWNDTVTSANEEWYMYDGMGQRVLRRSQTGTGTSNTKYTVYAFGVQDNVYDGSGASYSDKYYYSLAGHLIGELNGGKTKFLLTDLLGSVVASISNTVNSAAVLGNQVYGPYGNGSYSKGTITTPKGYTGQYNDGLTQLDYYNARYYDPFVGVFLSADTKQGNMQGMDPYAYVGGNPETRTDPSGQCWPFCTAILGAIIGAVVSVAATTVSDVVQGKTPTGSELVQAAATGAVTGAITGALGPGAGAAARIAVGALASGAGQVVGNAITGKPLLNGVGEAVVAGAATGGLVEGAGALLRRAGEDAASALAGGACSFTPNTQVTTGHGEQPIGKVHVGDKILAYNPKTHKMEVESVLHVWINHDNDLVDLTLTATTAAGPDKPAMKTSEVIHTNQKHPFFTKERGFLAVGQITLGMHVLRADGTYGVVTDWKVVPGTEVMYNLEVAQDHTFTVGVGQWVVHNCDFASMADDLAKSLAKAAFKDKHATISVAFAQDEEGNLSTLVGINSSTRRPWRIEALEGLLDGEGTIVPSAGERFHAEQNILAYMRSNNLELLGIGASRDICLEICAPAILDFSGGNFGVIGTPIKNYITGEVVWRPERFW